MASISKGIRQAAILSLALVALNAESSVSYSANKDKIRIDNYSSMNDWGFFNVGGKSVYLVVPSNYEVGLHKGDVMRLNALDLGFTPPMFNTEAADSITLEREGEPGRKYLSQPAQKADDKPMTGPNGESVPRLTYSFSGAEVKVGERLKISFFDKDGKPMNRVRYACAITVPGEPIFEGLSFSGRDGRFYCPVFALKLAVCGDTTPPPRTGHHSTPRTDHQTISPNHQTTGTNHRTT